MQVAGHDDEGMYHQPLFRLAMSQRIQQNVNIGWPCEQVYPVNDGESDEIDALRVFDF